MRIRYCHLFLAVFQLKLQKGGSTSQSQKLMIKTEMKVQNRSVILTEEALHRRTSTKKSKRYGKLGLRDSEMPKKSTKLHLQII